MREEIIQSTYVAFSEKGYNASLSEILGGLGLKKSSLYNYFDNKEELFLEMIEIKLKEHYNEQLIHLKSFKNLEIIDQLKNIFMSFIKSFQDIQKLKFWKRLLLIQKSSLLERTKDVIKKNEYPYSKKIGEILSEILETHPKLKKYHRPIFLSYISFIHGVLEGYLLYGDEENFNQYIEDVWSFFAKGLQCYLNEDH